MLAAGQVHAQEAVASACTGVSLPPSVVTNIIGDVLVPVLTPAQNLLSPLTGGLINLNITPTLASTAAGAPITLSAVDIHGNAINVLATPKCVTQADAYQLATPAGLSLGGGRITGLGTGGLYATAAEGDAIAFGNSANTGVGATGAVAIGAGASVTATGTLGSVALGQNSAATGTTLGNAAYLVGGTAAAEVNIGNRRLTGLAAGSSDTDAVNVAQLKAATLAVSGDALDFDTTLGAYSALHNGVATKITNVAAGTIAAGSTDAVTGDQLYATNQQVGANTTAITNLQTSIANGTADPLAVRYSDATKGMLTLGGANGTVVTNVAAGAVTATSTDAVNGAQLAATNQSVTNLGTSVASSLGGGSTVNANGSITAPSYQLTTVGAAGTTATNTYTDVGSALTGLDASITNVNTRVDAVAAVSDRAVTYDGAAGSAKDTITLAGTTGTRITNLTAGAVNATSTDAVDGAQLYAVGQQLATNTTNITQLQNGTAGFFQVNNTAGNPTPVASGTNAVAGGGGAVSSGANAVSLGTAATASGANSVALGAGSVADRDNSVSVGSATATRQITNVAAGTSATDAVNVGQLASGLNQTLNQANSYTDARLAQVGFDLSTLRKDANGGTAAAMALATIPQAYGPGMGMVGGGISTWGGEQAFAIGVSKASPSGQVVLKAGASINTRGQGGGSAGVGFAF
jgi:autotransporter adhesin